MVPPQGTGEPVGEGLPLMTEPAVSPVDLYYLVAQVLSANKVRMKDDVARAIVDAIDAHGLVAYRAQGPKVRQATAIAEAREHLRASESRFIRVGAQAAMAEALQGILVLMIEQQESQWDMPCDCFAGMPQIEGFAEAKPQPGKE
jgi:hypothetical protein